MPGHLGSARSGEDVAAWPRRRYSGHIFGGRCGHQGLLRQDPQAAPPAQRAAAQRPGQARRVAVRRLSNAERSAARFVTTCAAVGVVGTLLVEWLRGRHV